MSKPKRSNPAGSSKVVKSASTSRIKTHKGSNPSLKNAPKNTSRLGAPAEPSRKAELSKPKQTRVAKHRVTVTLDPDVVEFLQVSAGDGSMSAILNDFIRDEMERHQQLGAMQQFLDEQEALHGPVDAELVAEAEALLA